MNKRRGDLDGNSDIDRYERRLVKRERFRLLITYLVYGASFAAICGIFSSLADLLSAMPIPITQIFFLSLGLTSTTAVGISRLYRIDGNDLLIRSESIGKSHSVMISARELAESDPDHPFTEAIRNRAIRAAHRAVGERVDRKTIAIGAPRGAALLPVLLVVHLVLVFFAGEARSASINPDIRDAGLHLEEIGDALAARAEQNSIGLEIAEEMQRLGRELQRNRTNREETERAIAELGERVAKTIEDVESGAARGSRDGVSMQVSPTGARTDGDPGFPSDEESDFLEDAIGELESTERAGGFETESEEGFEELATERERGDEQSNLETARNAIESVGARFDAESERMVGDGGGTTEPSDNRERSRIADESSGAAGSASESDTTGTEERAGSAGAGDIAVEDTFTDDFATANSRSEALTDLSGEVDERIDAIRIIVRNLPDETRNELAFEDVVREYGQQLERAVVRSDVSSAMRSYVREYFIRLNEIEERNIDG